MKMLRTLLDAGPINRFKGQGCTHSCPQSPDAQQAASESARQLAWSAPARRGKRMWSISDMRIIAKRFSRIKQFRIKSARQDTPQTLLHVLQV